MNVVDKEELIEDEYHVSWYIIAYKLLFGVVETLAGLGLAFFGRAAARWYTQYALREVSEDPHDLLIYMTSKILPNVLNHHTYLMIYLLLLGSAKVAGAIGLIYKKNWGVDLLVGLTLAMFPFQFIRFLLSPSLLDLIYILVGLAIALYLINFKPQEWAQKMAVKGRRHNPFTRSKVN